MSGFHVGQIIHHLGWISAGIRQLVVAEGPRGVAAGIVRERRPRQHMDPRGDAMHDHAEELDDEDSAEHSQEQHTWKPHSNRITFDESVLNILFNIK